MSVVMELNREQFVNIFNTLRNALVREKAVQDMVDALLRTASIPLTMGAQIAVMLLGENPSDLLGAFLIKIGEGRMPRIPDGIESIQTIDLNLESEGKNLKDAFKVGTTREAAKTAGEIIKSKYGELWTMAILDVKRIVELFDAIYPTGVTEKLLREVIKMSLDKVSKDEIVLEPVPQMVATLQRIFGA